MVKPEYEPPVVIDYGSIAEHTFGDSLSNGAPQPPGFPVRPNIPSF